MSTSNEILQLIYNGKIVRTILKDGNPNWVLTDACDVLEIQNSRDVAARLDEDEVDSIYITDSMGRQQQTTIINESGLYNLIMSSRKPEAKQFKRWITHEVLPSIRKHGGYVTSAKAEEFLNNPDALIEMLNAIKKERAEKERLRFQTEQLNFQIKEYKPKAVLADAISVTKDTILIRDLAKILKTNGIETGEKRLFEQLRKEGFLIKKDGADFNSPTQKAMELGLFTLTETAIVHHSGITTISKTSRVTGKGQLYFLKYFLNQNGGNNEAN
ncbi:antirepressor [Alphaproteobacteria bacterium]|nr:antirepressor [Alphaproteobacteria bacterium]